MPFHDGTIMTTSVEKKEEIRRLSGETAATEATGSTHSLPVNHIKIHSTMKQRAEDRKLSETSEETPAPASPPPSSDSRVVRTSLDAAPFSAEAAAKAAYAIMNGESVSEIDLVKDDGCMFEVEYNDEKLTKTPTIIRPFGSVHSRSVGSISALSEVPCDRMSLSSEGTPVGGRKSYPSSVKILRTPSGQRINRRKLKDQTQEQVTPVRQSNSMPTLASLDDSHRSSSPVEVPKSTAPPSPCGSLYSSPDKHPAPTQDEQEPAATQRRPSYTGSVRILRTPDGRRKKENVIATRHSFAGVASIASEDISAISPASAVSTSTPRKVLLHRELPRIPMTLDTSERDPGTNKGVKFDAIHVRYYERVIDVNPACSSGVAIGLGWNYNKSKKLSLNEFELQKGGVRYHARQLVLPRRVREEIAREFGYTQKDIAKGTRANLKIRNERKQTIDNLAMMPVEEKMEGAKRKLKKVLSFRRKKVS